MAPVETISSTEISGEEFKQLAKGLLKETEDNGEIFDYIDAKISKNAIFKPCIIRALVLAVHEDAISVVNADFKLNQVQYEKRIAILSRYIHNNKNLESETLNTIQY
ncbi:Eukaryotic translation initiation factor 4 gamma 3, partial [Stegodyphus mimosarum]